VFNDLLTNIRKISEEKTYLWEALKTITDEAASHSLRGLVPFCVEGTQRDASQPEIRGVT
jgi:hypothetical protein